MLSATLEHYINELLDTHKFHDYCPNGLQVEGRADINKIVSGVTANMALIEAAIAAQADAILVHHGYFWKGEDACLIGTKARRVGRLLAQQINLFAYHLPLDAQRDLGNNAQLALKLGLAQEGWFGEQNIAAYGTLAKPMALGDFAQHIESVLQRQPLVIGDARQMVRRAAWCSGAAQNYFGDAIALGVDTYITGEISEQMVHVARETGIAFIAAGHHATERYGVQALGKHLSERFKLQHQFIDIDSPV